MGSKYRQLADKVDESLRFMKAIGGAWAKLRQEAVRERNRTDTGRP